MNEIKKTLVTTSILIFALSVIYTIAQQHLVYSAELEQLQTLEKLHSDIFDKTLFDKRLTKIDGSLKKVEDIHEKLKNYSEILPVFDNGQSFINKLVEISEKTGTKLKIIKNTKFTKEFYAENIVVLELSGSELSLMKFADFSKSIKQINSLKNSFLIENSTNAFRLEISVYSLNEDDEDFYVLDKSLVNSPYMESAVWLPYFSEISKKNVKKVNQIITEFKNKQNQVDKYYSYHSNKLKFLDRTNVIYHLSKARRAVVEAFEDENKLINGGRAD